MHLMVTSDGTFTLKKFEVKDGVKIPTKSAHPARYSPDDQYSKQRIKNLKRHGLLLTQQPPKKF